MSTTTITVMHCDRCGHELTLDPGRTTEQLESWGQFASQRRIGDHFGCRPPNDLCGGCIDSLTAWFAEPNAPLDQPAPPPQPPRPRLTLDASREIAAIAERELRAQVERVLEVMRDQPTSILSGEILPGVFDGCDTRAAEITQEVRRLIEGRRR